MIHDCFLLLSLLTQIIIINIIFIIIILCLLQNIITGIYREVYLIRKPAQFIADYEFTSDITIPTDTMKKTKKAKKAFNVLDDFIDNLDEGKNDIASTKVLTANVNINVLSEGMTATMMKEISDENEALTYAVRAEIFENNTTQHGSVLTLTGRVMKVRLKCIYTYITSM